jgi:hypothetical protein
MRNICILAVPMMLTVALAAGTALAQGGPSQGGCGRGMFTAIDANSDGMVSREEFLTHVESVFAVMDQKGDGKVSKDEFVSLRMGPGGGMGPRAAGRQAVKASRFEAIDTNHDGTIDKTELMTWEMARFDKADTGHRGKLSLQQFCAMDR